MGALVGHRPEDLDRLLRVARLDGPAGITVKDEAARRRRRAAAAADSIRHILLPRDLITGDCGPVAAHCRADRRRLRAAVILLSLLVGVAITGKGARADCAGYIEEPGIRVV